MPSTNQVLWGEGLFLRPQHFQQQALHIESRLFEGLRQTHSHPWGARRVQLDIDALRGGIIRLKGLELTFRDGTQVNTPNAAPLPQSRNLADIAGISTETCIYACLPMLNTFGGNCAEAEGGHTRPTRFLIGHATFADLYTEALAADITTLLPNIRLLLEEENRDGHECIAIARIVKNAGGLWEEDTAFIPPLIETEASSQLRMMTRRLLDIMLVKSKALATTHRERVKSIVEYGTSDIASFWLLHTVNRTFPLLKHYAQLPTHPESLYALLAQLCGELMTFSSERSISDIPSYDHEHLSQVFSNLDQLIRELLDTVVSNRYAQIPLNNTKPSFLLGRLDSERLVENVDYYLSISSDWPTSEVLDMAPLKLKIGSPDDVEKILNSALGGVRLAHAAQTPSALPVRVGNHYFVLEPQGPIFERMLRSRSICIYVPQALLELKLELFAVFR
ncbi:MAG: type VI secretion system baseplate subunit TssK [Rhodocyclales bacterium GT-UBC]|nr:MAG: type VI secretion system baseplate subunit TssK [Rhodocyclales bacterium GT-UBC]